MTSSPPRSLAQICEAARQVPCPLCQAPAGNACITGSLGTAGFHVARHATAYNAAVISGPDFTAVTEVATVFTGATIVFGGPDCAHLHSNQGPGCPWCAPAAAAGAR
jgi:hypothetical protein